MRAMATADSDPQELYTAVDAWLSTAMVPADPVMEQVLAAADEAGLPPINIEANQGRFLELLARLRGANRILELGTLGGYSTIWLARGVADGGTVVTLENEPACAAVAEANFALAGVADRVDLRLAPALDSLAAMKEAGEEPFDLVFLDADKENYPHYLEGALALSRPGTLLVADNVVRGGRILDEATEDPSVQGSRRFNRMLGEEPRLLATALQVVGAKGHDGLALALVRD
jgi:predicted O-methyltransferase YrrM